MGYPTFPIPLHLTWMEQAACVDEDPELFFPLSEHGPGAAAQTAEALSVCSICPVAQECLRYALDTHQTAGIWGGLTERERQTIHRQASRLQQRTILARRNRRNDEAADDAATG